MLKLITLLALLAVPSLVQAAEPQGTEIPAEPAVAPKPALAVRRAVLPQGYHEVDGVVATVGDTAILISELRRAMGQTRGGNDPIVSTEPRSVEALRKQTLDTLIDNALVAKAAKDLGLVVSDGEVDGQMDQTRKRMHKTADEFEDIVRNMGFPSVAAYRQHVRTEMVRVQMLRAKIAGKLRVTDDEVKRIIDQEFAGGQFEDEVHSRHMLIGVPDDANPQRVTELRDRAWHCYDDVAVHKKPWDEVAEDCNDDAATSEGHGDLGWQKRWTLDPTFGNKLWSLQAGEISTVVQTPYGFHIIQFLERRRVPVKDKEVLEQFVRARLQEEQFTKLYKAWLEEMRASAHIDLRL
jgi:peptidyl-prolyl cis-trans isomerase SurA